jgi:hypothetical protein
MAVALDDYAPIKLRGQELRVRDEDKIIAYTAPAIEKQQSTEQ